MNLSKVVFPSIGFITLTQIIACCNGIAQDRDKIVFQDSAHVVQDSIILLSSYLDSLPKRQVNNIFFDNAGNIYINNINMGSWISGDSTSVLNNVDKETGFGYTRNKEMLSLAHFLSINGIDGCFRHTSHEINFFTYKRTLRSEYNDQRYIVVVDEKLKNVKGSYDAESYNILDQLDKLLLIEPATKKK